LGSRASIRITHLLPFVQNVCPGFGPVTQDASAASLAGFLRDLRSIPVDVLQSHDIAVAWITRSPDEYRADYEGPERELVPHANPLVRRTIRDHFEPALDGTLDLRYEPCLVHGDLKPWYVLATPDPFHRSGVLDWDDAGVDDPAQDLGAVLTTYGESLVWQMAKTTPEIVPMIDRAPSWPKSAFPTCR
jgi:aminoglycoside 2''-phosphotransferase